MTGAPALLGVTSSITGLRWAGLSAEVDRAARALSQTTSLPDLIARVLAARGVKEAEVESFLAPKLRDLLPNPSQLRDMDVAAGALVEALLNRSDIAIFADYDVDGGASAALLQDWLRQQGHSATLYIPDRIDEGYGPNVPAMEMLAGSHALIICVDCGTLSHEPIAAATALGAQVIVLDHHQGAETLPGASAVVNPNRQDETGTLGHLCAAAVVFLTLVAANALLRKRGHTPPDLLQMLDLVALATVADVAPLLGVNRAFVRQGLAVMANRARPGLVALADVAKLNSAPTAYHLGFMLGPRVNAGGRIGAADLGARLLSTDDATEAQLMASRLETLNAERRAIEAAVLEEAKAQAEARGLDGPLVWAAAQGWHPGVVGIVAARLKEWAGRPAVVIGIEGGVGKGSARSVAGVDLGAAIARLSGEGLLIRGGGHKMAAGLTVGADHLPSAMARLGELLAKQGAGETSASELRVDAVLRAGGATLETVELLEQAGPFGAGNPAPRVVIASANVASTRRVGENHLQATLSDETGRLDAIAFRAMDGPLGPGLEALQGKPAHVAGRLEIDDWGGRRKVKLRIEDAAATD
ncbi:MAG: single-stranded-DNA-specific exonuclease RecJ [Pseudomonadota bacterium]